MTKQLTSPQALDARRLPDGQLDWVRALMDSYSSLFESLTSGERTLYKAIWDHLAFHHAPATYGSFPYLHRRPEIIRKQIDALNVHKLLWFDDDLRGILQCPPFSVLYTAHQVKAFGWERIYTCSFLDIPITLLVYGPNVWLTAQSICPRSGETLSYRVKMREDFTLQAEKPPEADQWRVWLPLPIHSTLDVYPQFHRVRSKINAFISAEDLSVHREYHPNDPPGVVYTFEQSLYLSGLLLGAYSTAINPI